MRLTPQQINPQLLAQTSGLAFAVLVGSRANVTAHPGSDWDIALQWSKSLSAMDCLVATEELRQRLSQALQTNAVQVDLIDLADARLTMRALVAQEGEPLHIADDLAWIRFLQTTWAELEDNEWRRTHAA